MPFSTFTANKVLDCFLRGVAITAPSRVYVSLHTADPGGAGANEVSTGAWPSYARQDPAGGGAITGGFPAASAKATENSTIIIFPEHNGASPVTASHIGIWDAATGGNMLFSGPLASPRTINPTDELAIRPGELDVVVS